MARNLDGTTSEYLSTTSLPMTSHPCTWNIWFRTDHLTANKALISLGDTTTNNQYRVLFASASEQISFNIIAGGNSAFGNTSATWSSNTWTMATLRSAAADDHAVFLDGGNKVTSSSSSSPSANALWIGRLTHSSALWPFEDRLAEAAIWDTDLTDEEIAALYANGVALPADQIRPDSLVAYYRFFEDDGDINWAGNGYDLTANGTPGYANHVPTTIWTPSFFVPEQPTVVSLGQATATTSALPIKPKKIVKLGIATATTSALPVAPKKIVNLGIASATTSALPVAPKKIVNLGIATAATSALAIAPKKIVHLGIASATTSALPITPSQPTIVVLGIATATTSVLPITSHTDPAGPYLICTSCVGNNMPPTMVVTIQGVRNGHQAESFAPLPVVLNRYHEFDMAAGGGNCHSVRYYRQYRNRLGEIMQARLFLTHSQSLDWVLQIVLEHKNSRGVELGQQILTFAVPTSGVCTGEFRLDSSHLTSDVGRRLVIADALVGSIQPLAGGTPIPGVSTINLQAESFGITQVLANLSCLASASVDMKTSAKVDLLTVPTGQSLYVAHVLIRDPTASLAGGIDYDIGHGANADSWRTGIDLSSMTAPTDYMLLRANDNTKYSKSAAADVFGIKPITGSTAAANATVDVFGLLV